MIDKSKQYRTRDGREVRIYATDGGGDQPVHGAIKDDETHWVLQTWGSDGAFLNYSCESAADLIEVKPRIKRTVYINTYKPFGGSFYETMSYAPRSNSDSMELVACVKVEIDVEEGHFDE